MKLKRKYLLLIRTCMFLGLIGVGILAYTYAYPKYILTTYAEDWPNTWNSDLRHLNHKKIIEKIDPPDEDLAAKDYQSWVKKESWGIFQLRIGFRDCCDENSVPNDIEKIVRLNDRYEPIEYKVLLKESER